MRNFYKITLSICLCVFVIFSVITPASAHNMEKNNNQRIDDIYCMKDASIEDLKALDNYVYVEKGHYKIDFKLAYRSGISSRVLIEQSEWLDYINREADQGKIRIEPNKEFIVLSSNSVFYSASCTPCDELNHWSSCGGGKTTKATNHWWGVSRYTCDCATRSLSSSFNSCASVSGFVSLIGSKFGFWPAVPGGLGCAYWWLIASRLDANNHGKGVYIELTWVLVFNIRPQ